jgi:cell division protein FtsX
MTKYIVLASSGWIRFSFELLYILFGRIGSVGASMVAVSAVFIRVMAWSGVDEHHTSDFESRLSGLLGVIAVIGIALCCIGITIQKTRQSDMMREFGEVWWRGPRK